MGPESSDVAVRSRWEQDVLPELHNADALWGFAIRASEENRIRQRLAGYDGVMRHLLRIGLLDWRGEDARLHQMTLPMWHLSAMASRLLDYTMKVDLQVRKHNFCQLRQTHVPFRAKRMKGLFTISRSVTFRNSRSLTRISVC